MKNFSRLSKRPILSACYAAGLLFGGTLASLSAQTVYTWNGGTGNWSNGSFWNTGGAPNGAAADVSIDGGQTGTTSVVNLGGGYTVGRLTLDAGDTLNVYGDQSFTIAAGGFNGSGTLVNNGTVNISSPGGGHYAFLRFDGPGTLTGTGTVNLSGGQAIISANNAGDRLTIGSGATIAGTGNLGDGRTTFTNNGMVTANVNGSTLAISPGGGTGDFTNAGAGAVRAENGGVLELAGGGTFNNGSFTALAGSTVQIDSGVTVNNATLASSGTGQVAIGRVATTLSNVTVAAASTVNVINGSDVTLTGTLTNNGTVNVSSPGDGHYAFLRVNGPTTLAGTGTVNLSGGQTIITASNVGDRLTIGSGATIAGTGDVGDGRTTFTNNGTVTANVSGGTLTLHPGGGTADFTNSGFILATGGGNLVFSNANGGTLNNLLGSLNVGVGSTFTVPAGALTNFSGTTLTGGFYTVDATGASNPANATATLSLGGGSIVTNNASVLLSGAGATFTEINALANNQGSFQVDAGRNFTTVGSLTNSGTLQSTNGSVLTVAGNFNNSGRAQVSGSNGAGIVVQGTLTNSGQLNTSIGPNNTNTISATVALNQTAAGTLFGSGVYSAPTLALNGTLRPGDFGSADQRVGTLTLNGQVGFVSNTRLVFDLASTAASDQLQVNGALTLDGTLTVNALAGFGTGRYDLINYTGTLTNNTLDLGALPAGYNYSIDLSQSGEVDLVVTNAVPEPSTWAALLTGGGLLGFALRRRRSGARCG